MASNEVRTWALSPNGTAVKHSAKGQRTTTTLDQMLREQAESHPDNVALVAGEESWTYRRLWKAAEHLARAFSARGVMTNVPEMIVAFYACFRIGAVAVPLHVRFRAAELRPMLEQLRPSLYLGQAETYFAIDPDILPLHARFVIGGDEANAQAQPYETLVDDVGRPIPEIARGEALAVLLVTSGTTGRPKFVAHTQATLTAATSDLGRLGLDDGQIVLQTTTMAHVSGLFMLVASVRLGIPIVLLPTFDAQAALDAIELHRCSWMLNLPFTSAELVRCQRAHTRQLGSLRTCVVGGDACPPDVQQTFGDVLGTPLRNLWASTETMAPLDYGLELGPVSRVAAGTTIRLVNDVGVPVPRGETGELLVRAPGFAAGYWTKPGHVENFLENGFFRTGDLMRQGDGDNLWFVSRKKEMLVRGGDNVSPVEVERVLLEHHAVRDAAVTGVPDAMLGQRIVALVQLNANLDEAVLDDIRGSVASQLASYKVPERLHVVASIPTNAIGKTDRRMLLAIALDEDVTAHQSDP